MASSQPYTVACNGGLVKSVNSIDLLKTPGVAKKLQNFEVATEGGYRRINGYTKYKVGEVTATQPTGGIANILGTLLAGWAGKRYGKKWLLSGIYAGRSIAAIWFILTPITANTVLVFSFSMGFLWLATVPLTSGLVAHIYGLKYMATLYGIVFFSHQLGSFVGVYLGGVLYDAYGSYTTVWWIGIAVGIFSSLIHLPVREEPRIGITN